MFASCPRKYAYSYYGSRVNSELARLKTLSNMKMWAGSIVHDSIETYLKSLSSPPTHPDKDAIAKMAEQWHSSLRGDGDFRLIEHEYKREVSQEDKADAVNTVKVCLANFTESQTYYQIVTNESDVVSLEDKVKFHLDDVDATVVLRMDAAFRSYEGLVISDWKTGKPHSSNAQQMLVYALYAMKSGMAEAPEEIQVWLEYLKVKQVKRKQIRDVDLAIAEVKIKDSIVAMKLNLENPRENIGVIRDFSPAPSKWKCWRCPFLKVCEPGQITLALNGNIGPGQQETVAVNSIT